MTRVIDKKLIEPQPHVNRSYAFVGARYLEMWYSRPAEVWSVVRADVPAEDTEQRRMNIGQPKFALDADSSLLSVPAVFF